MCAASDARQLTTVRLASGRTAIVCGTHALMYERSDVTVDQPEQLRALLRDRRRSTDRRSLQIDELGAQLTEAFSFERRVLPDRRA